MWISSNNHFSPNWARNATCGSISPPTPPPRGRAQANVTGGVRLARGPRASSRRGTERGRCQGRDRPRGRRARSTQGRRPRPHRSSAGAGHRPLLSRRKRGPPRLQGLPRRLVRAPPLFAGDRSKAPEDCAPVRQRLCQNRTAGTADRHKVGGKGLEVGRVRQASQVRTVCYTFVGFLSR